MTEDQKEQRDKYKLANQLPQNRKERIDLAYVKVLDAIESNEQTRIINSIKIFIAAASAEIVDKDGKQEYDITIIDTICPQYSNVQKEYFHDHNLLIPELAYRHEPTIRYLWREKYKDRLIQEFAKIENLLKQKTNWVFDKSRNETIMR